MNFTQYALSPALQQAIHLLGYDTPTKVQAQVIPAVLDDRDVLVQSQTGSGKTASFVIPICEKIDWEENAVQALILTPTRELALQIKEDVFHIGRLKRVKCTALYGRDSFAKQAQQLKQKCHITVGTPGRVADHLERGTLNLSQVRYLVIDEADEMLSMGFIDQVEAILQQMPTDRITLLLSATMKDEIAALAARHMKQPLSITIESKATTVDTVTQEFYEIYDEAKKSLLQDVTMIHNPDSCIIFCNTQITVDEVEEFLFQQGYPSNRIHGGMEQVDRTAVMHKFKRGEFRYLVATDVAARGIDVDDISLVVNFDLPKKSETYVHRIGRTGRIGKEGIAVSFVSPRDQGRAEAIAELLGHPLAYTTEPQKQDRDAARPAFQQKLQKRPQKKVQKGDKLSQNILKLHINAGKKTKMRPTDIVGTLCALDGMTAADIGIINILDISTFVEILNGKGEAVYQALQTRPIKGRLRTVSRVERD